MARIRASMSSGGGQNYYHATSMPSDGVVTCGFQPKHILVLSSSSGLGCNIWDESDSANYVQYWNGSIYNYAVGDTGGGSYMSITSTGFTYVSTYASRVKEIIILG